MDEFNYKRKQIDNDVYKAAYRLGFLTGLLTSAAIALTYMLYNLFTQ